MIQSLTWVNILLSLVDFTYNFRIFTLFCQLFWRRYCSKCVDKNVPFATLQSEIDADRPVEVAFYQRRKEKGHLVIIRGWYITEVEKFVHVNDPKDSNGASRIVVYSDLLDDYEEGKWMYTWLEIQG